MTTPNANWSERKSTSSPAACSGDMYSGVPMISPGSVLSVARSPSSSTIDSLARPKSSTFK